MSACARTAAVCGLGILLIAGMPRPGSAEDARPLPPRGARVRATTAGHGRVEGTVAWVDASGLALSCPGRSDVVRVAGPDLVLIEVYQRPPSRMEMYAAVGGFVGLGIGLLTGLPALTRDPCRGVDPLECDPSSFDAGDDAIVRTIALTAAGAGVGALAGLAVEREQAWQPVALRWDPQQGAPHLQVALRF